MHCNQLLISIFFTKFYNTAIILKKKILKLKIVLIMNKIKKKVKKINKILIQVKSKKSSFLKTNLEIFFNLQKTL